MDGIAMTEQELRTLRDELNGLESDGRSPTTVPTFPRREATRCAAASLGVPATTGARPAA